MHLFKINLIEYLRGHFQILSRSMLALLMSLVLMLSMIAMPTQAKADTSYDNEGKKIYIRYEAHTAQGKKNLESFRIALTKMREMDCQETDSWYYQGAIHWVPSKDNEIQPSQFDIDRREGDERGLINGNPLCSYYSGFSNEAEARAKLLTAWQNCTHDNNSAGQSSQIHFLPWHRLYVYHLEKIVRELSGDSDFALPYWDYISMKDTELPNETRRTMPVEFTQPLTSSDEENSLYEASRDNSLMQGVAIRSNWTQGNLLKAVQDLSNTSTYSDYNSIMDWRPHGVMHVYLGGGALASGGFEQSLNKIYNRIDFGLMYNVASAGFDPIFWMHHGNVDRLWAQWTDNDPTKKVTVEELEAVEWPYKFFEPNGDLKEYTPQQVVDSVYNMDYVYDDGSAPNVTVPSVIAPSLTAPKVIMAKTFLGTKKQRTVLKGGEVVTQMVQIPKVGDRLVLRQFLLSNVQTSQPHYSLDVEVTYIGRPRGEYEVYLNLPEEKSAMKKAMADIDTYYLGTISFFVLDSDKPRSKTFKFDITDELLKEFGQNIVSQDIDSVTVSIIPKGVAGGSVTLEGLTVSVEK